jgi:DNA replicative helicase MCM subunit Mcm2 (Cdc46/Mcm family)
MTWEAKTVIIGAANPHGGNKWDDNLSIQDNIKLPDSMLSRMALIILVKDSPDPEKDLQRAKHIMLAQQGKLEVKMSEDDFKKFINHCRTLTPTITDKATETLMKWWSELRAESQKENSPLVDNRVLEDMIRMSYAYARWRMSDTVVEADALKSIKLLQRSLLSLGMNTPGERAESNINELNKQQLLEHIFQKPITESQAIQELLKTKHFNSPVKAKQAIANLRISSLTELESGELKWVS